MFQKPPALFGRQPVPQPDSEAPHTLHPADPGGELRAEETSIGSLVGHPAYGGQAQIDCGRRVLLLFEVDPIAKDDGTVEREAWLGAVPSHELTNGVIVRPLSAP
jgi:hypothetical protein